MIPIFKNSLLFCFVMEEETTTSLQQLQLKIEELHEDIQVYQHSLSHFITNRILYLFFIFIP